MKPDIVRRDTHNPILTKADVPYPVETCTMQRWSSMVSLITEADYRNVVIFPEKFDLRNMTFTAAASAQ